MGKLLTKSAKLDPGRAVETALVGKDTYASLHPLGTSVERSTAARIDAEKAAKDAANEEAIPLPDQEAIAREERRRAARRRGAQTVFSTDEGFGG